MRVPAGQSEIFQTMFLKFNKSDPDVFMWIFKNTAFKKRLKHSVSGRYDINCEAWIQKRSPLNKRGLNMTILYGDTKNGKNQFLWIIIFNW